MSPEFVPTPASGPDPTLRRMFGALIERAFIQTLGVYESHVADYLTDVLADFAHMQQVCKIRDLWQNKDLAHVMYTFAPVLPSHGAGLYRIASTD